MGEAERAMKSADKVQSATASLWRGALLIGAALILGGCVTGVGYGSPYLYAEVNTGTETYEPPPPLPDYAQPPCPGDGYLWVPGYWAYSGGYYWVPGTWVRPPQVGLLWTPGYWGFAGGAYVWHAGYWGTHVGFYGGVHYGFGYDGDGYVGGRWDGDHFDYNRYVTNVDVNAVHYTYIERVGRAGFPDRVSYNGGRGGIVAYPTREDRRFAHEQHVRATFLQREHDQQAARNPNFFARDNGGRPPIVATPRPGDFQGPGVERARGAGGFPRQFASPSYQARRNFPQRPGYPARPGFQPNPNFQAGPNFQPRPNFQAGPNFQARPNIQARPDFPSRPSRPDFQARPNVPARPDFQARPNVPARPNFQARPSAPARPVFQAQRSVPQRPVYQNRPRFYGQRPGPRGQSGASPGARRGPAGPPHGRGGPARDHRPVGRR